MSLVAPAHRPAFAVLFAAFVLFGTSATVIGAVLPKVLADFAWDYLAAGAVIAAGSVGYFLSAYAAGRVVDRVGFRTTLVAGLALDAGALLAFAATPSALLNGFLYFLVGVGQGFIEVAVNWSIVKMAPEGSGRPMSLMHGAFSVGAFAGPLAVGLVMAKALPWGYAYRVMGALFLGLAAAACLVPVRGLEGAGGGTARPRGALHREPAFWLGFAVLMLYVGVEMGVSNWMGEFFVAALGSTPAKGAFAVSVFWGGLLAGRFGLPALFRSPRQEPVLHGLGTLLVAATGLLAAAGFLGGVSLAFAASALAGFGCSCVYPIAISLVGEAFPEAQGEAMGFASAGGGAGAFLFPLATAYVARTWGIRTGYAAFVPGALAVLAAGLLLAAAARRRRALA